MSRVPVTVVTGFLGAGKTTLVRHLLAHAGGRRIALVINEFGELGVDREVLLGCGDETCREEDMIELSNGCICCTVADDFIPAMRQLLDRDERPDHIVIETSGLALPQPLIRAFNWPEIKSQVTIDGVVTLVDAAALSEGRFAADEAAVEARRRADAMLDHETPLGELFKDQIVAADLVVVNKTDLVDAATLARVEEGLRAPLRPGTGLLRAAKSHIDVAALLGNRPQTGQSRGRDTRARTWRRGPRARRLRFLRRDAAALGEPRDAARDHRAHHPRPRRAASEGIRGTAGGDGAARDPGRGAARQCVVRPALARGRGARDQPRRHRRIPARARAIGASLRGGGRGGLSHGGAVHRRYRGGA